MKAALAAIMKRVRHVDENVQLQAVTVSLSLNVQAVKLFGKELFCELVIVDSCSY